MQVPYRVVEMNDSQEWIPIGIALPHDGDVAVHIVGRAKPRHIDVSGVKALESIHLWAPNLRWGPVGMCSREQAAEPRRLMADLIMPPDGTQREQVIEEIIKRGATMEEIAQLKEPVAHTPEQAIQALKRGNSRFFAGRPSVQNMSPIERRAQTLQQTPFAVIVGCSDSRVPIEIVFDQGPGNLFIIRVAGNVMGPNTYGSIEYGVHHLKSHVVVVLGHEGCGAVAAALQPKEVRDQEPEQIRGLLDRIVPSVGALPPIRDRKARMREAVVANIRQQVHQLKQNPVVKHNIESGKIAVVGAYYSISSGGVDFYESDDDLALDPATVQAAQSIIAGGH